MRGKKLTELRFIVATATDKDFLKRVGNVEVIKITDKSQIKKYLDGFIPSTDAIEDSYCLLITPKDDIELNDILYSFVLNNRIVVKPLIVMQCDAEPRILSDLKRFML